jgi:hypothetical protein
MTRALRFLLVAAVLALTGTSQAQLLSLTHDGGTGQVATIDAASVVTPIGGPELPTELAYAAAAFDPFNGAIFALGPDPVAADGTQALFAFDTTTGVRSQIANIGSSERVAALRFELATQRLIAALVDAGTGTLRLASVDAGTGALTTIHTGVTDCCVLEPGVAADRSGELLLVGRRTTDPVGERYLIGLSTTGNNASTFTLLDAALSAIAWNRLDMTLYGVRQNAAVPPAAVTSQLVQVETSGTLTPIGSAVSDCCALAPGLGTLALSTPNALYTVGSAPAGTPGIIEWNLTTGAASFGGTLPAATVVNALFDVNAGLTPTTTTITSITPSPSTIGQAYTVAATVTTMGMIDGGTITIEDGLGNSCSFAAPTGSCNLANADAGMLTISAIYSGTTTVGPSFDTATHEVLRAKSTTNITLVDPNPVEIGQTYTVTALVSGFGTPTGTIDIGDGLGETCQIVLPATSCVLNAPSIGARTLTANYSGDANNLPSFATAAQQVTQAASMTTITSIVPEPSNVGDAYTVSVAVAGFSPSGDVAVSDGQGALCTISLPATSCLLANAQAGLLTVSAAYVGDVNNLPSADSALHTVNVSTTTTVIDSIVPTPSAVGSSYDVTVSVTGFNPTGTVQVDDGNGNGCPITLPATTCSLANAEAGSFTITAGYPGDGNNAASSDTVAHTVQQATSTTTIDSIAPSPSGIGEAYAVSVTVTGFNPTGTVDVDDGLGETCQIVLPATSCMLTSTSAGARTITAAYPGDVNNTASMNTAAHEVELATSTTVFDSVTPSPSEAGQSYTVAVTVTGFNPTGTVDVDDGMGETCQIVLPASSCDLNGPSVGARVIVASYPGDGNNQPSSTATGHVVTPATTTTTIDSIVPEPSAVGDAYTVNVTVTGFNPTGTVEVDDGLGSSCSIALPATSCLLANAQAGTLTVTALYTGDSNNALSQDSSPHTVDRAPSTTTIDSIAPSPANAGQAYTVSVSVTGFGTPSGIIAVSDDAGAGCLITLPATGCDLVSTLAGTRTITAEYAGDDNNLPSFTSDSQIVEPALTTLALVATTMSVPQGVPVTLVATISDGVDPVTGTVGFSLDGQTVSGCDAVVVSALQAACTTSFPVQGVYTLLAEYSGDANNTPAADTALIQVDPLVVPALSVPGLLVLMLLIAVIALRTRAQGVR